MGPWKVMIPEIAYARAQTVGTKPSTTGTLNVNVGNVRYSNDNPPVPYYMSYQANWGNGWGVCPAAAMKLTAMVTGTAAKAGRP